MQVGAPTTAVASPNGGVPAFTTTTSGRSTTTTTAATAPASTSSTIAAAAPTSTSTTATTSPVVAAVAAATPPVTDTGTTVTPVATDATAWAPTASDPGYTFLYPDGAGGPAAWWSPCAPIRFAVDLSDAPAGVLADALAAVAEAADATGLTFDYVGTTSFSPDPGGGAGQMPTGVDAVIGWVDPTQLGGSRGEDGAGGSWWEAAGGRRRIFEGFALVNGDIAKSMLRPGFSTGYSEGHVLLHELGHMLGLNHTGDASEVMYAQQSPLSPSAYGPADRTGLRTLGSQPCI